GYGTPLQWRGTNDLCFLGEEKARVRLYQASLEAPPTASFKLHTTGNVVASTFNLSTTNDRVAVVQGTPERFPDIYVLNQPEPAKRLTNVNPQTDTWKLPKLSTVSWTGANGDTVEGTLELPPDVKAGDKLPLVVAIHGGPTTASYFQLAFAPWEGSTLF